MANYTKINNFTAKDSLASGNINKRIRGSEFDAEFNAISTAITSKPDSAGVTSVSGTGTVNGLTLSGTVTSTGNLTLGGTLAVAANQITSGTLPVNRGGTGSQSPSLVAGANVTVSGTWPNQTISAAGGGAVNRIIAGSNITVSPVNGQGDVTISAAGGGGGGLQGAAILNQTNVFTQSQRINKTSGTAVSELFMGPNFFGLQHVVSGGTEILQVGKGFGPYITFDPANIIASTDGVYKPSGGSWLAGSDERLKTDIVNYTKGLAAIQSLRPVNYKFKDEVFFGTVSLAQQTNNKVCTGFIAQEVEQTELANMVADGLHGYKTIDVSEVIYALVNAVKELSAKVDAQAAEIAALKT